MALARVCKRYYRGMVIFIPRAPKMRCARMSTAVVSRRVYITRHVRVFIPFVRLVGNPRRRARARRLVEAKPRLAITNSPLLLLASSSSSSYSSSSYSSCSPRPTNLGLLAISLARRPPKRVLYTTTTIHTQKHSLALLL